jgi:hypothetical protein
MEIAKFLNGLAYFILAELLNSASYFLAGAFFTSSPLTFQPLREANLITLKYIVAVIALYPLCFSYPHSFCML